METRSKIASFLTEAFRWIFFVLMSALLICGLFVTGIHQKFENGGIDEFVIIEKNNLGLAVLILIAGIFLVLGFLKIADVITTRFNINVNIVATVVCALSFIISVTWINILKVVPGADQEFCVNYANAMNNGD
ncbi:MAG: hypothetical protein IKZ94_03995, partial [Lachnospiraceae bacterium]|nr:hypothetical protein [Lachnospiraceae bacterium]